MEMNNDNGFSLLKILAENELQRRRKSTKRSGRKVLTEDTNGITEVVKDLIYEQKLSINGDSYTINAADVENNEIMLWLFSEGADEEKTLRITLKIDELEVNPSYWNDENV